MLKLVGSLAAAISYIAGVFTGSLAGLVGLGGSELRIPFLRYALSIPIRDVVFANLLVALATSTLNFILRLWGGLFTGSALTISVAMILGSAPGGIIGAEISRRLSMGKIRLLIAIVLAAVIARLIWDILAHPEGPIYSAVEITENTVLLLALVWGLLIGVLAGAIGVAGGEYRIPVLMFFFGLPIKLAGSVSQLVSIPTVLVAGLIHQKHQPLSTRTKSLALLMGLGSITGVIVSTYLLTILSETAVRWVFILILAYAVWKLMTEKEGSSRR